MGLRAVVGLLLAISVRTAIAAQPHVHYKSAWKAADVVVRLEEGIQLTTDAQVSAAHHARLLFSDTVPSVLKAGSVLHVPGACTD
jgi:hypothetical protein